jgi:hypothetical protein
LIILIIPGEEYKLWSQIPYYIRNI